MLNNSCITQEEMLNVIIRKQFKENNVSENFSEELKNLTEDDFILKNATPRKDLRNETAFTIDSADCKDMDDAVSIEVMPWGYILGVHIADVSEYVTEGSALDKEAVNRGTSIYLPNLTIPMLPKVLTNNLCSLVEGKDRNTLSILIALDHHACVKGYAIMKGLICSRVKGVYDEVNQLFRGKASSEICQKYAQVSRDLFYMKKVYKMLREMRIRAGANVQDNSEPKILIQDGKIYTIPHQKGEAENMIEEFMVLANHLVAEYMIEKKIPAMFRTQHHKKIMASYRPIVDNHAELALNEYCHFTSPIRRYPDLFNHRMISYYLSGIPAEEICSFMDMEELEEISDISTRRGRRASNISQIAERFCYTQFFLQHMGETFSGTVVDVDLKERTVIRMDQYNLTLFASASYKRYMGQRITFTVEPDKRNTLRAYHIKPLLKKKPCKVK